MDDLLKFSAKEIPGYLQAFADDLVTLAEGSDTAMQESGGTYVGALPQDVQVDLHNSGQTHIVLQRYSLGQNTRQ